MRTAGMVMGIVGGAISLLLAILIILGGVAFMNITPWTNSFDYDYDFDPDLDFDSWDSFDDFDYDFNNYMTDDIAYNDYESMGQTIAGGVFVVLGIGSAIAGILGLVGGLIIKKKNVAAGVMMIIAAVLSLVCFLNIISMALFILGGIFALMRDRQQQVYAPPYYPYPPQYPQPSFPPQQYPQQYPQQQTPEQSAPPQDPPEPPQP